MGEGSPENQIFGPDKMREIAEILRLPDGDGRIATIGTELEKLGLEWQKIIRSGNFDLPISNLKVPPSRRIRWLKNNVQNPVRQLIESLDDENEAYFSYWGTLRNGCFSVDRQVTREAIGRLDLQIKDLLADLYQQQAEGAPQTGEARYEIVWCLVQVLARNVPEKAKSAGVYDEALKQWIGSYPEFVEAAFAEITGGEVISGKKLNNLLRLALKDKK